jgi:molybdate transport repressor ModE-like protein
MMEIDMSPRFDLELLRSFLAIAESGSFTRAAADVNLTQSAVSMQMKRLEAVVGRPLVLRDGRQSRLTGDGERLAEYARRIIKLHDEAVAVFVKPELAGAVRLGTPDDYADRFLPEILARFARTHPLVQVDVECLPSSELIPRTRQGEIDLSVITCCPDSENEHAEVVRQEPLVWAGSVMHDVHRDDPVPLAVSSMKCDWRRIALSALDRIGKRYRIAYASPNSNALNAAVLSGLAVGAIPQMLVRAGMRVLSEGDGFPPLEAFNIGLIRSPGKPSSAVTALAQHIGDSLARIERPRMAAE